MRQLLKKKEKGVSAVIGTILMVAITVVAAAAVFMYVSGYFSGAPSQPVALIMNEKNIYAPDYRNLTAQFTVTQGSVNVPFVIKIINTITGQMLTSITINNWPGGASFSTGWSPQSIPAGSVTVKPYVIGYDNNNNGKLDTGDAINIGFTTTGTTAIPTNIVDQWQVQIVYNGGIVYTYNLNF